MEVATYNHRGRGVRALNAPRASVERAAWEHSGRVEDGFEREGGKAFCITLGEVRATNTRIDAVHVELRTTRTELTERIDANTRELIRHATAIVDLEKGQREILTVLKEHSRVLQEHTSALALLIRKSDEQGARIDNVLLGVPGQTMRDVQRRVALIEQKLGLVG